MYFLLVLFVFAPANWSIFCSHYD